MTIAKLTKQIGLSILLACGAGCAAPDRQSDGRYDNAAFCSKWLQESGGLAQGSEHRRSCVIAVASTYINAEENSLSPDNQLFTDDVSRHRIGAPPNFMPGNRAKLMEENSHQVIAAIKNRRWTVDGDEAWILYDGYLRKNPDKIGFYVAERITLEKGLIREILVADVTVPK